MVLSQIYTTALTGVYQVNLYGKYKCRIIDIHYVHTGSSKEFISMYSSKFYMPNGNTKNSFIFANEGTHNVYQAGSAPEFEVMLSGSLDLTLTKADGTAPSNFGGLSVTFDFVRLDDASYGNGIKFEIDEYMPKKM
jgi:hypothetical protein